MVVRFYRSRVQNHFIEDDVKVLQTKLHQWGAKNRVSFDASKESHHILSQSGSSGSPFRLLGVRFDTKLNMAAAVFECTSICNSKLQSLLRARKYYTHADVLRLFKAHIMSFIEYRTTAIAHASPILLESIDDILTRLLVRLGVSHEEALMHFNLAPLNIRRDIAQLGIIHRTVLKKGPPHFQELFPRVQSINGHFRTVYNRAHGCNANYIRHSIFNLVGCYNRLPIEIVSIDDVSGFQSGLQELVQKAITEQHPYWRCYFRHR